MKHTQHVRYINGHTLHHIVWLLTFAAIFWASGCASNSVDGDSVDDNTSVAPKIYLSKEGGAPTVSLDYGSVDRNMTDTTLADPNSIDPNSIDPNVTEATETDSDEHDIHTVHYTPLIQTIEVVDPHAQNASAQDTTQNADTQDTTQSKRTLRYYRGMPLVVNFFAAWCPPCVREMPEFNFVFNKLKNELDGEVAFLGLSQDSDVEDALDLVARTQVDYDIGWDPKAEAHKTTGSLAMPTTVFITPEGEVAEVFAGVLNREGLLERIAAIRTASR